MSVPLTDSLRKPKTETGIGRTNCSGVVHFDPRGTPDEDAASTGIIARARLHDLAGGSRAQSAPRKVVRRGVSASPERSLSLRHPGAPGRDCSLRNLSFA